MGADDGSAPSTRALACSEVGDMTLAVDAHQVANITDLAQCVGEQALDLAALLHIRPVPPIATRRVAWINHGSTIQQVVMGEHILVRNIPSDAFCEIPAFVAQQLGRLGIREMVTLQRGFAYVIDTQYLGKQMSQGSKS